MLILSPNQWLVIGQRLLLPALRDSAVLPDLTPSACKGRSGDALVAKSANASKYGTVHVHEWPTSRSARCHSISARSRHHPMTDQYVASAASIEVGWHLRSVKIMHIIFDVSVRMNQICGDGLHAQITPRPVVADIVRWI